MKYPLPHKTSIEKAASYRFIPEYNAVDFYFPGISVVSNVGGFTFFDDDGSPDIPLYPESVPFTIQVSNPNDHDTQAALFGATKNEFDVNYGSSSGIRISSMDPGISYSQILQSTKHVSYEIGMTRIEVIKGPDEALKCAFNFVTYNNEWINLDKRISPTINPHRFFHNIHDFWHTFVINQNRGILINIPPHTTINYIFYPAATRSPNNGLLRMGMPPSSNLNVS